MADLELVDALTDSPPEIEPEIKRDFISSLEAEPYDDVIGEKFDKTDYVPLLDDDEANGSAKKQPAEGSHPSVLENGEHNTGDVSASDPFGSSRNEDVLVDLLPPQVQICPAFSSQPSDHSLDEGWLTDSYSKSGDTDTQSADASEKTTATFGETPSDESTKLPFQVPQSDSTSHIWQPTVAEQIALGSHNAPEHEGNQVTSEESAFDSAPSTESQLLPGLESHYLEQYDREELVEPDPNQGLTSVSFENPDSTTVSYVHESHDNPIAGEHSEDQAACVFQSVESEQPQADIDTEQVIPTCQSSTEPPPSPDVHVSAEPPVSPFEVIQEDFLVSPADQFPAENQAEPLGAFIQEETSPVSSAALDQDTESPSSPTELGPEEVPAFSAALVQESEVPAILDSLVTEAEVPASPVGLVQEAGALASLVALVQETENPATLVTVVQEAEGASSIDALAEDFEVPSSPGVLVQQAEAPATFVTLIQEAEAPAAPVELIQEAEAPAAPVELIQKAEAPAAPVELIQEAETPAAPVELIQKAEAPAAPVELIQEAEAPAAPVELIQKAEAPAAPVELIQKAEAPAAPVELIQEAEAPAAPVALLQTEDLPVSIDTVNQEAEAAATLVALAQDKRTPPTLAALHQELLIPAPQEGATLASPVPLIPTEALTPLVTEENQPPGEATEHLETNFGRDDLQQPGDQVHLKQKTCKTSDRRLGRAKPALAPVSDTKVELESTSPSSHPPPSQPGHSESLTSRAKALHKKAHDMMESRREAAREMGDPESAQISMKKKKKKTKPKKMFTPREMEFGEEDAFTRAGSEPLYTSAGQMGHVEPLTRQDHLLEQSLGIAQRETHRAENGSVPAADLTAAKSPLEGDPITYPLEKAMPAPQNVHSPSIRHLETPPDDQVDKSLFDTRTSLLGESGEPDTSMEAIFGMADTDVTKCPYLHPEILLSKRDESRESGLEKSQGANEHLADTFQGAGIETVKWDKPKKRDKKTGYYNRGGHYKDPKHWQNFELDVQAGSVPVGLPLYPGREEKPSPLVPLDDLQKCNEKELKRKSKSVNKNICSDSAEPLVVDFGSGPDQEFTDLLGFDGKMSVIDRDVLPASKVLDEWEILTSPDLLPDSQQASVPLGDGVHKEEIPCTPLKLTDTVVGLVLESIQPKLNPPTPEGEPNAGQKGLGPVVDVKTDTVLDSKVSIPETRHGSSDDGKVPVLESKPDTVLSCRESPNKPDPVLDSQVFSLEINSNGKGPVTVTSSKGSPLDKADTVLIGNQSVPESKPSAALHSKMFDPVLGGTATTVESKSDADLGSKESVPEGNPATALEGKVPTPDTKPGTDGEKVKEQKSDTDLARKESIPKSKSATVLEGKVPTLDTKPGEDDKELFLEHKSGTLLASKEPVFHDNPHTVLSPKGQVSENKPCAVAQPLLESQTSTDLGRKESPSKILGRKGPAEEIMPITAIYNKEPVPETKPDQVPDLKVSTPENKPSLVLEIEQPHLESKPATDLVELQKYKEREHKLKSKKVNKNIRSDSTEPVFVDFRYTPENKPTVLDKEELCPDNKHATDLGGIGSKENKKIVPENKLNALLDSKEQVPEAKPDKVLELKSPSPERKSTVVGSKEAPPEKKQTAVLGNKELTPQLKCGIVFENKDPLLESKPDTTLDGKVFADESKPEKVQVCKVPILEDTSHTVQDSKGPIPENKPGAEPGTVLESKEQLLDPSFSSPAVVSLLEPMVQVDQPLPPPIKGQGDGNVSAEKQVKGKRGKVKAKSNGSRGLYDAGEKGLDVFAPPWQPIDQPQEANFSSSKKAERGSLKRPHSSEKKESLVLSDAGPLSGKGCPVLEDSANDLVVPLVDATPKEQKVKGRSHVLDPLAAEFSFLPREAKIDQPEWQTIPVLKGLSDDILNLTAETQDKAKLKSGNVGPPNISGPSVDLVCPLIETLGAEVVHGAQDQIVLEKMSDVPVFPVEEIRFSHGSDVLVVEKPLSEDSHNVESASLALPGLLDINFNFQGDSFDLETPKLEATVKVEEFPKNEDDAPRVPGSVEKALRVEDKNNTTGRQDDKAKTVPVATKVSTKDTSKTKLKTSPPAPGLKERPVERALQKSNKTEENKAPEVLKGYMRPTKARAAAAPTPPTLTKAAGLSTEKPKQPKETRLRTEKGKAEAVASPQDVTAGGDITAPPTKELPASPEKKVKASTAATPSKSAATPKSKPLAAPSPRKPLSATPAQPKKPSTPTPATLNNTTTPKRPLGSAAKTTTPKDTKEAKPKSPVKTPDRKPLTSVTTPRSAVKASPAATKLGTSAAANTTGTSAPKPNLTPKRPTTLKNDVKAAEAKKTNSAKSPSDLSRPKSVPSDPTKSNGAAPTCPAPAPSRPKTTKPAASKPLTGPSTSADAKKQPAARPAPLSRTSTAPASKPSTAPAASKPSAAPKQPRPSTAPDLKNVRSKIGSTDNLKHQPGGGKQAKVEKKPVPASTARKPVPAPAATKTASTKPADPKETVQKQSNGKVQIVSKKVNYSHVQSKCGSKDNIKHVPGGGNVTNATKASIGSSRPPASTSHKPVQIVNKKVDVSKVSSKCGSKPNAKAKTGAADAKAEDSSKKTETTKQEPGESIKENGGEQITAPQNGDLATPTDNTAAVDTRENGVGGTLPVDGGDQREIQSFSSLIPETN
ncbi:titin-like isoform X3 [Dendropsophus ebraccatus]|uniref:titin-like isoform X3 n=1 Tax=Dendropsophus ebraccatus TaxID=150705 RepID=UPI0038318444